MDSETQAGSGTMQVRPLFRCSANPPRLQRLPHNSITSKGLIRLCPIKHGAHQQQKLSALVALSNATQIYSHCEYFIHSVCVHGSKPRLIAT